MDVFDVFFQERSEVMLIYANSFFLSPNSDVDGVMKQIALWVGRPRKAYIDPLRLKLGMSEIRLHDGATLSSITTLNDQADNIFPYYFCAKFSHGQPGVPGRRWVTEIGLKQISESNEIQCSVLLRTDEISAKVTDPIQVTRPRIAELILKECAPLPGTPGLSVIQLTEENATAFSYEIERPTRRHPIVEISRNNDGAFPVSSERLQSVLVGIAQVIEIPNTNESHNIEIVIGRKYTAFGGAINIISPYRETESGGFCKTTRFKYDQLVDLIEGGVSVESEILATVTHQTNLGHSWRHVSSDNVREALLRSRLRAASSTTNTLDAAAYDALLQEASDSLASKDRDLAKALQDIEVRDENLELASAENDALSAENEALRHSLSSAQVKSKKYPQNEDQDEDGDGDNRLSNALKCIISKQITIESAISIIDYVYSDRVVFLDTAYSSARDSDRSGFKHGNKALDLLKNLATEYWTKLKDGNSQNAAKCFGRDGFATKESENITTEGIRRRTFRYNDESIFMEKHLKHGVKDSYAETLRIHFEWIPETSVIVVGHCGKHLDF